MIEGFYLCQHTGVPTFTSAGSITPNTDFPITNALNYWRKPRRRWSFTTSGTCSYTFTALTGSKIFILYNLVTAPTMMTVDGVGKSFTTVTDPITGMIHAYYAADTAFTVVQVTLGLSTTYWWGSVGFFNPTRARLVYPFTFQTAVAGKQLVYDSGSSDKLPSMPPIRNFDIQIKNIALLDIGTMRTLIQACASGCLLLSTYGDVILATIPDSWTSGWVSTKYFEAAIPMRELP